MNCIFWMPFRNFICFSTFKFFIKIYFQTQFSIFSFYFQIKFTLSYKLNKKNPVEIVSSSLWVLKKTHTIRILFSPYPFSILFFSFRSKMKLCCPIELHLFYAKYFFNFFSNLRDFHISNFHFPSFFSILLTFSFHSDECHHS